jgi:hypothetical protein
MSADFGDMSAFFDDAGDGCFAAKDLSRGLHGCFSADFGHGRGQFYFYST